MSFDSDYIVIYLEKLAELFEEEGFPRVLQFETPSGELISYILEDEYEESINDC
jgi:hypothetical protein